MKKIILTTLATILVCYNAFAQTPHLCFKDVPMDGQIEQFAKKLCDSGFQRLDNNDKDFIILTGHFAGKDTQVTVTGTAKSSQVLQVTVFLPEQDTWQLLKSEYTSLKKTLDSKYSLIQSNNKFSYPFSEGDGFEMTALADNKCNYSSAYKCVDPSSGQTLGNIFLSIVKFSNEGCVTISYFDHANNILDNAEKEQILFNDL